MSFESQKIVTVDGPSASGKSSLSRSIARAWGWKWVSTGAFYRGLALLAQAEGVNEMDHEALETLAKSDKWKVVLEEARTAVFVNGTDMTDKLGGEDVGKFASQVSRFKKVREVLLPLQRGCAKPGEFLIAEGRDCGTVVFPDAFMKIYLTASSESRAKRRAGESEESFEDTLEKTQERDLRDIMRSDAPLKLAEGAIEVDSTHFTQEEVLGLVNKELDEALIRKQWK